MTRNQQEQLKELILKEAEDNKLPCSKAFSIAADTGLSRAEVGQTCNELGVKIANCQLGCF